MSESKAVPMHVIDMVRPVIEADVSPPTRSTLYLSQARRIPAYNSSRSSTENRLLIPRDTVICVGVAFMA